MTFNPELAKSLFLAAMEVPPEVKEKKDAEFKEPKAPREKRANVVGMRNDISVAEEKSDFIDERHLVEYLLMTHPKIRYEQTSVLVKKHFPGKNYDAGNFTWFKLEMQKYGKCKYHDKITEQLKETT
jgi:hypothetical protein